MRSPKYSTRSKKKNEKYTRSILLADNVIITRSDESRHSRSTPDTHEYSHHYPLVE
jgi:hypothetical protein